MSITLLDFIEDLSNPLFCRLTIDKTKEEVLEVFRLNPKYTKCVVSQEKANRQHYHVYARTIETSTSKNILKNLSQNLRNYLHKSFPGIKDNSQFAVSTCSADVTRLESYVVKEGNFCYYGFSSEEINLFVERSYSKEKLKTTLSKEVNDLIEEYLKDPNYTIHQFLDKFYELRISKYRRPISYLQAKTFTEFVLQLKYPEQITKTIQCILDDIGYSSRSIKSINLDDLEPLERKIDFQEKQLNAFKNKIKKSKINIFTN